MSALEMYCVTCGALIERKGLSPAKYAERRYCSRKCIASSRDAQLDGFVKANAHNVYRPQPRVVAKAPITLPYLRFLDPKSWKVPT